MSGNSTFAPSVHASSSSRRAGVLPAGSHVIVIGAGVFGAWTALHLLRARYRVTLVDAWGPGNSRSSSGDETRVIRSTYGANAFYFQLNVRSTEILKAFEQSSGQRFFEQVGALWFCYEESTPVVDDSITTAEKFGITYDYLTPRQVNERYPAVFTRDLHHAWFDPSAGFIRARDSVRAVVDQFCREGGSFEQSFAEPGPIHGHSLSGVRLSGGSILKGDCYLFACGSWLGKLFPDVLGHLITCTRQEVYYLGIPRERAALFDSMPVWVDADGQDFYYGIPGNANRGFKVGVDRRGATFDPTSDDRLPDAKVLSHARAFIAHRFPELKHAPLVESRVCPYESSPDGNFIFDHHPQATNCWFLGGGSGHGFKHGPGLGEIVAGVFKEGNEIPALFHKVA